MARLPICKICGKPITKTETAVELKNGKAHEDCFNAFMKAVVKNKKENAIKKVEEKKKVPSRKTPKQELKDGLTEEEHAKKIRLLNKIKELQNTDKLTAKTYKLVEDYIEKYGFTYDSMREAFEYHYEIMGKIPNDDIIGLLPYIHDDARKFFTAGEETLKANENVDMTNIDALYPSTKVRITPKKPKIDLIDIGQIGI